MEKRTVLAIVISIIFILIWQKMVVDKVNPPKKITKTVVAVNEKEKATERKTEAIQSNETVALSEGSVNKTSRTETDSESVNGESGKEASSGKVVDLPEEIISLENKVLKLEFTNKGGRLVSVQLKDYRDEIGEKMELVNQVMLEKNLTPFSFEGKLNYLNNIGFTAQKDRNSVSFLYQEGLKRIEKRFELDKGFGLKVAVVSTGFGPAEISLGPGIDSAEKSHSRYSTPDAVVVFADGSVDRIKKEKLDGVDVSKQKPEWVAIEDKYFAKIFTPDTKEMKILGAIKSYKGKKKDLLLSDVLLVGNQISGTIFLGPKDYDVLKKLGHHYAKIVNFGFFGVFAKWLFFALRWINGLVHNYGWSIILLTILIRLLIFPVSQAGLRSMKDMQRVQPKMKEIQAKYKKFGKDLTKKQEMNREIQELYKKEGVSPLGGCLPMILQMPIFFAFWSLLLNVIELRHAPFMFWIQDLSAYDPYYVLPVLMGVTQLISQMITPSTGDANQKKMMYALPVVFTVVLATAPSGLIVYWTTNNLFQIVQQMLVNRSMKEAEGE
ncbi:MAG: hypothetical protein DRJ08_01600 [Acidobacteria bacterium]|nr:MAG: hypothetical protein DRJ08_01600 [Acidobacteriota bacterium]